MCARGMLFLLLAGGLLSAQTSSYTLEKEAALGKQLAAEFAQRHPPLEIPAAQLCVEQLGRKLAAAMPDAQLPFAFRITNGDSEPVALPGGHVFVPAGLFLAAQDEAEFAGILAHTMEHIVQRQVTRPVGSGVAGTATIPLVFVDQFDDSAPLPAGFRAAHKANELEADAFAVPALARAGYDPAALMRYLERMPDPGERLTALSAAIAKLPPKQYAAGSSQEFGAAVRAVRRALEAAAEPPRHPPSLRR